MSFLLLEKTVSADSVLRFLLEGLELVPAVHIVSAAYIIPAGQHIVSAVSEVAASEAAALIYCCDL